MKSLFKSASLLLIVLWGLSLPAEAQILNRAINKVANKAADKLADQAADALVKDMEKYEVKDDETGADQPMIESLPENRTIKLGGNGNDLHMQYQMRVTSSLSQSKYLFKANLDMYQSSTLGGHVEMAMKMPMVGLIRTTTLTFPDQPDQITIINHKNKSYHVVASEPDKKENQLAYKVTKIGKETLWGLSCTHGVFTSEDGQQYNFWTTREVPNYQRLVKEYARTGAMGDNYLWMEMKKADCDGVIVKMEAPHEQGVVVLELAKMEKITASPNLFKIPEGYKKR